MILMAESCNHIGAMLYALVAITNQKKDGTLSSTSRKCEWNNPRKRKLSPKKMQDLTFRKTKFDTSAPSSSSTTSSSNKPGLSVELSVNVDRFRDKLQKNNSKAGWLLNFASSPVEKKLPQLLSIDYNYHDSVDFSCSKVKAELSKIFDDITITASEASLIETKTRGQSKNWMWKDQRSYRITSSNFGRIVTLKETTEPDSTLKQVLYADIRNKYTEWGIKHEAAARVKYLIMMKKIHKDVKVSQVGLIVSPDMPYLGASPDGVITYLDENEKEQKGLIEIKCPASEKWKHAPPEDCSRDKEFFCYYDDISKTCKLKSNHNYYFQVMGQLAITGYPWCDFVVWTLKGLSVERLYFNQSVWQKTKVKLEHFYKNAVLPELFSRRVQRGKKLYV